MTTLNVRWEPAEGKVKEYKVIYVPTAGGAETMVGLVGLSACCFHYIPVTTPANVLGQFLLNVIADCFLSLYFNCSYTLSRVLLLTVPKVCISQNRIHNPWANMESLGCSSSIFYFKPNKQITETIFV